MDRVVVDQAAVGTRVDDASNGFVAKEEKSDKPLSPEMEQVSGLYKLMLEKRLETVELKDEESCIRLTRRASGASHGPTVFDAPTPIRETAQVLEPEPSSSEPNLETISTPLAGVFYRASSPTSAPFVKEGDVVDPGQSLCIVEAMKVMNEIKAESRCRIQRILAENGRPVTAGQPLFQIEPA